MTKAIVRVQDSLKVVHWFSSPAVITSANFCEHYWTLTDVDELLKHSSCKNSVDLIKNVKFYVGINLSCLESAVKT